MRSRFRQLSEDLSVLAKPGAAHRRDGRKTLSEDGICTAIQALDLPLHRRLSSGAILPDSLPRVRIREVLIPQESGPDSDVQCDLGVPELKVSPPTPETHSMATSPDPTGVGGTQTPPFISASTAEEHKRAAARSLFEEYGVDQPQGWLLDEENLSLLKDGNADARICCRVCHVCSAQTWYTLCLFCGHRLCDKCRWQVAGTSEGAHTATSCGQSHTLQREDEHHSSSPPVARSMSTIREVTTPSEESLCAPPSRPVDAGHTKVEAGLEDTHAAESEYKKTPYQYRRPWDSIQESDDDHTLMERRSMPLLQRNTTRSGESIPSVRENPFLVADRGASRNPESSGHATTHTRPAHLSREISDTSHKKQHSTAAVPTVRIIRPSEAGDLRRGDTGAEFERRHTTYGTNLEDLNPTSVSLPKIDQPKPDKPPTTSPILKRDEGYEGSDQLVADNSHAADSTPPGRLFSPPEWLRQPRKQASPDVRFRLRHVETKNHGEFSHTSIRGHGHAWAREWPPPFDIIRGLDQSSQQTGPDRHARTESPAAAPPQDAIDTHRPAGPSPPTALHVTHHQRREFWMDHHHPHTEQRSARSTSPAPATAPTESHVHEHICHDPTAPAFSLPRRSPESLREHARSAQAQQERQDQHRAASPIPSTAAPAQPKPECCDQKTEDVPPLADNGYDDNDNRNRNHHASTAGDLEPHHHPDPVPALTDDSDSHSHSEHTCRWRDQCQALAAEVRAIKAELSARQAAVAAAAAGEDEDEDGDDLMGLQSLTIILRRGGNRRDVVIETDLERDCEGDIAA